MRLSDIPTFSPQPIGGIGEEEAAVTEHGHAEEQLALNAGQVVSSAAALGETINEGMNRVALLKARNQSVLREKQTTDWLASHPFASAQELRDQYGGEKNIPSNVLQAIPGGALTNTVTDQDGTQHTFDKTDIPRFAFGSDLYHRVMTKAVDDIAVNSGLGAGYEKGFRLAAQNQVEKSTLDMHEHSVKEAQLFHDATLDIESQRAMRAGDFIGARHAVDMMTALTPAQRQERQYAVQKQAALYPVFQTEKGTDTVAMQSMINGLRDDSNGGKFDVKNADGTSTSVDTQDLTEVERRQAVLYLQRAQKREMNAQKATANQNQDQLSEAVSHNLEQMMFTKNIDGVRSFQANIFQPGPNGEPSLGSQLGSKDLKQLRTQADGWLKEQAMDARQKAKHASNPEVTGGIWAATKAFEAYTQSNGTADPSVPDPFSPGEMIDVRSTDFASWGADHHVPMKYVSKFIQQQKTILHGDNTPTRLPSFTNARNEAMKGLDKEQQAAIAPAMDTYLDAQFAGRKDKPQPQEVLDAAMKYMQGSANVVTPGKLYGTNTTSYTAADVPKDMGYALQKLFPHKTAPQVAAYNAQYIEPYAKFVEQNWETTPATKGKTMDATGTASILAGLASHKTQVISDYQNTHGMRHPTDAQLVQFYMQTLKNG